MTSASVLTITDRENGNIRTPVYYVDAETPLRLAYYESDGLALHAKKGVTYTVHTSGAFGLMFNVVGPGIDNKEPQNIGSTWTFTATADAVYSIGVASAEGDLLPGGGRDRPYSGSYIVDVYANVADDVGLTLPQNDIIPIGLPVKLRLGTASDSDQAFFTAWAGTAGFFAAYSTQVRDVTVEVQSSDGRVLGAAQAGGNGMALLSITAPTDGMYKALVRSGGYRQEGEYEAFSGQRLDPEARLSVGRPTGESQIFNDGLNREVWAWAGENQIQTGAGHDTLVGSREGNDVLSSGSGDDNIIGFGGLNIADGGPGRDTFVVAGIASDFQIVKTGGGLQVSGATVFEHVDDKGNVIATFSYPSLNLLTGIEYVKFFDQTLDVRNERWLRDWITLDRPGGEGFFGFEALNEARLFEGNRADFGIRIEVSPRNRMPPERDPYGLRVTVERAGVVDTLYSVERLLFDDGGVALDFYPGGTAHRTVATMLFIWGPASLSDQTLSGKIVEHFRTTDGFETAASYLLSHKMIPGAGENNRLLLDTIIDRVAPNSQRWIDANGAQTPILEWRENTLNKLQSGELTQAQLVEQALLSPDMNHQVQLTGLPLTGLLFQDETIAWGS
jgi:hypothetical protein